MQRILVFAYGALSYIVFFLTFLYAIGFVGNIYVPKGIDSAPQVPLLTALLVNLGLLALFAVQHSLMARPFFKRWITRFIPQAIERSTYVLASSLALIALFVFWQPMGGVIWAVNQPLLVALLQTLFVLGWLIVLSSTFLINHFDLFGLRQVWLNLRNKPYTELRFVTPLMYSFCRHPLYLGFLLGFWMTPVMTVAHLLFALGTTGYILVAIQLEERDLIDAHPEYLEYRRRVPMIIPIPGRRRAAHAPEAA
ncbi:isoprenylcysteine carboxylmethyltransferase family protein [Mangrovimicrobium sediminis]|uniref:methanethiol S-methyltransferase n=1 Tax=Mangrovimicrobium sediminis TaxID=2562682 RepID=A0A4Z0M7U0_9GAMM|nr:methanethiol S-methyltransferase [Haliea sp. SAOS-164]TGD75480.1 isoprenylcysteine carboxylmethyltransferase family protein [Haliea sp. SAOS-164]